MNYVDLTKLENVNNRPDGSLICRCPACAKSGHDKMGNHLIIYRDGRFGCAKYKGDNEHNKIIRRLIKKKGATDEPDIDIEIIDPEPKLEIEKTYPKEMLDKLVPDHSYWIGRHIDESVMEKMRGGLAPFGEKSKLSGRYVFPIIKIDGKTIVGWSGRLVKDSASSLAPKWKHLMKVSSVVYPAFVSDKHIRKQKEVILVESIGDCLSLFSAGIYNVLVIFGLKAHSKVVGYLIAAGVTKVIVATNNDLNSEENYGLRAARNVKYRLASLFNEDTVEIHLPPKNDFNDMTKEEIVNWYNNIHKEKENVQA